MSMQSRRSFLGVSATAFGAVCVSSPLESLAAESSVKRPLKKGVMLDTVGLKVGLLEKLKAIKEAGFDGIEPSSHMNQDEVVKGLEATGLRCGSVCCSTHWEKPVSDPDPAVREAGVAGLKQALRDAKRYGAVSVLFVPGAVSKQVFYDDAYSRAREAILKAIPLAEELGVKIALENVWNNFLLSPLEAARFVDEFRSPMVGWHFDCGNIVNYSWPEQWVRILGKRIITVHIKEFSRQKGDKEGKWAGFNVALLEGDNDWPAIMKALDEVGFAGWAISEQGGVGTPEELKGLSERMNRIFAS